MDPKELKAQLIEMHRKGVQMGKSLKADEIKLEINFIVAGRNALGELPDEVNKFLDYIQEDLMRIAYPEAFPENF